MKIICTKENLLNALQQVNGIATKHVNLPILNNILIQATENKVEIVSTNLDIALKVILRAKVEEVGSFTVPAKTLLEFVNFLPESQISVVLEGNELVIECGSSKTKIKGAPSDEYPVIPEIEEKNGYSLSAEFLKEGLSSVIIAAAKNEIRQELSGIYFNFFGERFGGLLLAATDSYRLAEKKIVTAQGNSAVECIVPGRTAQEIIRLLNMVKSESGESMVRLLVNDNQIGVRYDNFELSSRLLEGKYPNYAQIVPSEFKTNAKINTNSLIKNVKAASLFSTLGINGVSFSLNPSENSLNVSSASTQTGEHSAVMEAKISGEANSVILNFRYLIDGLQNINKEFVEFNMNGGDGPCLFRPDSDDSYIYIVMPIRQ